MDVKQQALILAQRAAAATPRIRVADTGGKNRALQQIADLLMQKQADIQQANQKDIDQAASAGLSKPLLERLTVSDKKIKAMADGALQVMTLPDPVSEITGMKTRPNGMIVGRMRVPLGVIFIIYESRPDVTIDAAVLCIKSGNAVILRGGRESLRTNKVLADIVRSALAFAGLPEDTVVFIDEPDRQLVNELLRLDQYIQVVIPRGGESLIRTITETSKIPVIKHYHGICIMYVDKDADMEMAMKLCHNAKCQRPATCNAMETMLVHKDIAAKFLPGMIKRFKESGVEIRGCAETVKRCPGIKNATEADWKTEYLDLILAVRVVDDADAAMVHIDTYGSHHSDAIITENHGLAMDFLRWVDSAAVYVNASTRFTDGFEFGLGAEMGISTDKLHCRGPMGLEDLTIPKWIILGNGQIRE